MKIFEFAADLGLDTPSDQMAFLADCLQSGVYDDVRAFAGDAVTGLCPWCCFVHEAAALNDSLCKAMALRAAHGLRRVLQ